MKQNLCTLDNYIKMFCYLFTLFFPMHFGLCLAVIMNNVGNQCWLYVSIICIITLLMLVFEVSLYCIAYISPLLGAEVSQFHR